jgi:DNA-binding transcriptional ArsR family regulator
MAICQHSDLHDAVTLAKALGDEARLRALCALRSDELCVCQLVGLLGLAQSTVSKHMSILHRARLVDCRRQGRWLHYRLAGTDAAPAIRAVLDWVLAALAEDGAIAADAVQVRRLVAEHDAPQRDQCPGGSGVRRGTDGRTSARGSAR